MNKPTAYSCKPENATEIYGTPSYKTNKPHNTIGKNRNGTYHK